MTTTPAVRRGRTYRRRIFGLIAIGIASLLAGMMLERSLTGLAVYAVAVIGAVGLTFFAQYRDSVLLQDERERELGQRASSITFQLFGYLGLFAFVALLLLDAAGIRSLSATAEVLLYTYAVICLTWGAIYTGLRYR